MDQGKSLPERTHRWYLFVSRAREYQDALPQLAADIEKLDGMFAEASALLAEIALLRAQARIATRRLRVLAREGDMLRTRMAANVRGHFGFDSPQLIGFGLEPRPRRRRRDGIDRPAEVEPKPAPEAKPPEGEPE